MTDPWAIMRASDIGICELCEHRAADYPDCFCVTCRIEVTAMSEIVNDPILRILSQHQHVCFLSDLDSTLCRCGQRFEGGPHYHRQHLAELIYDTLELVGPLPNTPAAFEDPDD